MPLLFCTRRKVSSNKYKVTPVEACHEPNFSHEAVHGQCKQKRNHGEHTQVQGQMDASGALRCDFIVYTEKEISVEGIPFDAA